MDEYMLHVNSEVLAGRSGQRRYGGKLVDYPNGWMGVVLGKAPGTIHAVVTSESNTTITDDYPAPPRTLRAPSSVLPPFQDALPSNEDFPVVNCHLLTFIIQSTDLANIITKPYKDDVRCSMTVVLKQANLVAFDLINAFAMSHESEEL
ncbi:hypothetical protein LTS12_027666 [Elasticomyces elasticus]|nr:hypothetical protein LTS12_027666 [Elasticomyces elasticus]